jgi:hypothetical protein
MIGLALTLIGFRALSRNTSAPQTQTSQQSPWWAAAASTVGLSILTVFLTEFLSTTFKAYVRERQEKEFEAFFGARRSKDAGCIVLQADGIDVLVSQLMGTSDSDITKRLDQPISNRFFKARTWINVQDAEAASAIRDVFRELKFPIPEIVPQSHNGVPEVTDRPYVIITGLGFTDATHALVEKACGGWLRIMKDTPQGDVVGLNPYLHAAKVPDFNPVPADGYTQLFMEHWNIDDYKTVTSDSTKERTAKTSPDYAIVLRNCDDDGTIRFVVAGFTAHGTAAAGRYLAKNWAQLYGRYRDTTGACNFCEIIKGGSGDREWKRAAGIPGVTPAILASEDTYIDCKWAKGYKR